MQRCAHVSCTSAQTTVNNLIKLSQKCEMTPTHAWEISNSITCPIVNKLNIVFSVTNYGAMATLCDNLVGNVKFIDYRTHYRVWNLSCMSWCHLSVACVRERATKRSQIVAQVGISRNCEHHIVLIRCQHQDCTVTLDEGQTWPSSGHMLYYLQRIQFCGFLTFSLHSATEE